MIEKEHIDMFDFGLENKKLYEDNQKKNTTISCPKLETGNIHHNHYKNTIFIPWLMKSLQTLSSYHNNFVNQNRDQEMMEWLKEGASHSGCKQLERIMFRCTNLRHFNDMLKLLRQSTNLREDAFEESARRFLLSWQPNEFDIHTQWNEWLDRYTRVPTEALIGHDSQLHKQLEQLIQGSSFLLSGIASQSQLHKIYATPNGEIIHKSYSKHNTHLMLACEITNILKKHKKIIKTLPLFITPDRFPKRDDRNRRFNYERPGNAEETTKRFRQEKLPNKVGKIHLKSNEDSNVTVEFDTGNKHGNIFPK
ncbi:MAG: hypothetical protein LAT81_14285 [Oceanicaulis sp.]|nr:hypothetical protein [Oceanicaulis sp.]